jgi:hypothetical protein
MAQHDYSVTLTGVNFTVDEVECSGAECAACEEPIYLREFALSIRYGINGTGFQQLTTLRFCQSCEDIARQNLNDDIT